MGSYDDWKTAPPPLHCRDCGVEVDETHADPATDEALCRDCRRCGVRYNDPPLTDEESGYFDPPYVLAWLPAVPAEAWEPLWWALAYVSGTAAAVLLLGGSVIVGVEAWRRWRS